MKEKESQGSGRRAQKKAAVRASITFPPALYSTLEEIAKEKKVSLAWVVRDASERYVTERSDEAPRPGKG
jgi:metal-responsive CopG/Arc/MetJ family transcriptional regulator